MVATCYTKDDVLDVLRDAYFTYKIIYREVRYAFHGGQPEEGIYYCNTCSVEWGDEHEDSCYDKTAFEAVEAFIERGLHN